MFKTFFKFLFLFYIFSLMPQTAFSTSDTMLMFVGEDLELLSIASKREEAAWKAPAAASVITSKEFNNSSYSTVSDVLSGSAGFHVENFNSGPEVYLRGIPNSALFLYDTVPMGSNLTKSGSFINNDITLASLKRIEIIRGSGSVLWGADAFAGVVNYVPLTGKDFQGFETGASYYHENKDREVYFKNGRKKENSSSFLSLSYKDSENDYDANIKNFFGKNDKPVSPDKRFGNTGPDDSRLMELHYNGELHNLFSYSINLGRNEKGSVSSDPYNDYTWTEKKSSNSGSFKIESKKDMTFNSSLRFTTYYSFIDTDHEIIDKNYSSSENTFFSELIYDHECFNYSGLVTAGVSYRESRYNDVPVWQSYIAGYFKETNTSFLPELLQEDLESSLFSQFVQYHHYFNGIEVWAGLRNDNHEKYEDKISRNTGITIPFKEEFIIKAIYGTAYRTPFAKQYFLRGGNRLEEITGFTLQFQWKPSEQKHISITGFTNKLENHVVSDRYEGAGLSLPNSQTINGIEFESKWKINNRLELNSNLTRIFNSGSNETYLYNDYDYVDKNGNKQKHYTELFHDYDAGPKFFGNMSAVLKLRENISLIPQISYFGKRKVFYFKDNSSKTYGSVFTSDLVLKVNHSKKLSYSVFGENILNRRYQNPGFSDSAKEIGTNLGFRVSYKW